MQVQELCAEDPVPLSQRGLSYFPTIDVSGVQVQELCAEDPVPLSPRGPGYFLSCFHNRQGNVARQPVV